MRHKYDDLFQYALREGKLVFIDEVKNGLECNCYCPQCDQPLVAHNNPESKHARHFQHQTLNNCEGAYETVLHHLAKDIIHRQGFLEVPDVDYVLSEYAWTYERTAAQSTEKIIRTRRIHFENIEVERSVGTFKPDLKCMVNGKVIYIEVAVTHFVDETKKNKIMKDNNAVLEIDLSNEERNLTSDQLSTILSNAADRMSWVNNPKIGERYFSKEAIARGIKNFVASNSRTLKVYGKNRSIYNCPMNKRSFESQDQISVPDICNRCRYLVAEHEASPVRLGDEQPKYVDNTIECIGHVAAEYCNLLKTRGVLMRDGYWGIPV